MDPEDSFYHVRNRGNERRAIFRDAQDGEGFLTPLSVVVPAFGVGYTAVEQACRRAERHLKTDRKFRRVLQAITR
jgi:hypothetical protein